jgi:hypothetical protein
MVTLSRIRVSMWPGVRAIGIGDRDRDPDPPFGGYRRTREGVIDGRVVRDWLAAR